MSKFYRWIVTEYDEEWHIRANNMKDSRNRIRGLLLEDYNFDIGGLELDWNDQKGFGYVFFGDSHPNNGMFLAG